MNLFQLVFIPVFLVAAAAFLTVGAKKDRFARNRIFWSLVCILGAASIAAPDYSTKVATLLGIGRGTDLLLYLALILGLIVVRYFYLRIKKLESHITILARQSALRRPERGSGYESRA